MKKTTKLPKTLWAFWANCYGPRDDVPRQVKYNCDLESWWNEDEESEVQSEGLIKEDDYICFSSRNKAEVQRFIDGFMACRNLLKGFFV